MSSIEFDRLSMRVNDLLHMIESLQLENAALRQKIAVHIQARSRLQHKNIRAAKNLKQLLKQMKEATS